MVLMDYAITTECDALMKNYCYVHSQKILFGLTCHLRRALKALSREVSILAMGHGDTESCTDTRSSVWNREI